MSSLLDIARSGLMAYQNALAVAGENISNVNTEGYVRQNVQLSNQPGAQASPLWQPSGGGGVTVEEVQRAFSELLANRARRAEGAEVSAQTRVDYTASIENLLIPGKGGIDTSMQEFFSALSDLSSSPASLPLRQVTMQAGGSLAAAVVQVATGLSTLREDLAFAAGQTASQTQGLLSDLAKLQEQMLAQSTGSMTANAMATQRDAILDRIGQNIGISVSFDDRGRAEVSLGESGILLVERATAAKLSVQVDDRLSLVVDGPSGRTETRLMTSGKMEGLSQALGALDYAISELDEFARRMADAMNGVQTAGHDLNGDPGAAMFSLSGWQATPGVTNQGLTQLQIRPGAGTAGDGALTLVRSGSLWEATNASGAVLGTGANRLSLPGLEIELSGTAAEGDRFTIDRTDGKAINMTFLLSNAREVAAAASALVQPLPANGGSAALTMIPATIPEATAVDLPDLLSAGKTASDAVTLLQSGVVARIPASGGSLNLAALGQQSTVEFALTPGALDAATALTVTAGGTSYSFDLSVMADGSARPSGWTGGDLAEALNSGALLAGGQTLAQLGLRAAGAAGQFSLASGNAAITAGDLTGPGLALAGTAVPGSPVGGDVQVFTRNGVHLAGSPLTPAQAASLLTEANGFLPGATYDATRLNTGYRGMEADVVTLPGREEATVALAGIASWSGSLPAAATPPQVVQLSRTGEGTAPITVPEGATAALAAARMNGALPGLTATATTAVQLSATDGTLTFELSGDNSTPITLSARVAGGDMTAVAGQINRVATVTGLRAEVAPDRSRLLMVSDTGATITIGSFRHDAGGTLSIAEATPEGSLLGGSVALGAGLSSARITGRVELTSPEDFSVTQAGVTTASAVDGLEGGLIARTSSNAGATQALSFRFDAALDGAGTSADGTTATAAGTQYSVTLGGKTVSVDAGMIGAADAADVTRALATALRAGTPDVTLTGVAVPGLPPDGAALDLTVDGQTYQLSMQNGTPVVTGPEPGRVQASFDASNRLTLSLTGTTDGSGIGLKPSADSAARAFGLASSDGPMMRVRGGGVSAAGLPAGGATLRVSVAGNVYSLQVMNFGGTVQVQTPAGFPGAASVGADGAISLLLPAHAGSVAVGPPPEAGFDTLGASVAATGDSLTMTSADGGALMVSAGATALSGNRLQLDGLPPEDLLVAMTGSGTLRLAGGLEAEAPASANVELRVLDAGRKQVGLFDSITGDQIAATFLGADGRATLAGYSINLGQGAQTGDRYALTRTGAGSADGSNLENFLSFWTGDESMTTRFAVFLSDIGSSTSAAKSRLSAAQTQNMSAQSAKAELSAVDLDTEAANLLELQQAYQGNAQALGVARDLFETLLKAL